MVQPAQHDPFSDKLGAYALFRIFQGESPSAFDLSALSEPWQNLATLVHSRRNGLSAFDVFEQERQKLPGDEADRVRQAIMGLYVSAHVVPPKSTSEIVVEVPELPAEAQFDITIGHSAGHWVDTYTRYASAVSPMTPEIFHESAALALVATAIARRLKIPMPFGDVFPNLYLAWIAPSGQMKKTTGLTTFSKVITDTFPHLLLPSDITPESWIAELGGIKPANYETLPPEMREIWDRGQKFAAQKIWMRDEMSGLLASAGRDYMSGVVEAFMALFDCGAIPYTRRTQAHGLVVVPTPYPTFIGCSTPEGMGEYLHDRRLWHKGFWPRFVLLTPETTRLPWKKSVETRRPPTIQETLERLYQRLPAGQFPTPGSLDVQLGVVRRGRNEVYETWDAYNKSMNYDLVGPESQMTEGLKRLYARLPVLVLKVSTLLAALDWETGQGTPVIEMPHLARALVIVERWRASAHRTLAIATVSDDRSKHDQAYAWLFRGEPQGMTLRDLERRMTSLKRDELERILTEMESDGRAYSEKIHSGTQGGRPTVRWHAKVE